MFWIFSINSKKKISEIIFSIFGCFLPIWVEKKSFVKTKNPHFLKDFCTISYPNKDLPNFKRCTCKHVREKIGTQRYQPQHIFWLYKNNPKYASYFVMNGYISLKFLYKSKTQHCSHRKNKKNHKQNVFFLRYENCLKSGLK